MKYVVDHEGREICVEVRPRDDGRYDVSVDGETLVADLLPCGGRSLYSLVLDHDSYDVAVVKKEDRFQVSLRARELHLRVESEQERDARLVGAAGEEEKAHVVKSQMPGIVTRVLVREGEDVEAGCALLILEAMKMENEVRALHAGSVQKLWVKEGQTVNGGDQLVTIG